jgi:hypothetical protein
LNYDKFQFFEQMNAAAVTPATGGQHAFGNPWMNFSESACNVIQRIL